MKHFKKPDSSKQYKTAYDNVQSLKVHENPHASLSDKLADRITEAIGSMLFLNLNVIFFLVWIVLNLNIIPGLDSFDPFPFGMLTMLVSLEAIILSIAVLISQNNAARIADLREEIDLYINTVAEREITKVIELIMSIAEKNGVNLANDAELGKMLKPLSIEKIEHSLEKQIVSH